MRENDGTGFATWIWQNRNVSFFRIPFSFSSHFSEPNVLEFMGPFRGSGWTSCLISSHLSWSLNLIWQQSIVSWASAPIFSIACVSFPSALKAIGGSRKQRSSRSPTSKNGTQNLLVQHWRRLQCTKLPSSYIQALNRWSLSFSDQDMRAPDDRL